jgi:outer membrane immunogenic protein
MAMNKVFAGVTVLTVMIAAPAFAADMAVKAPRAVAPACIWCGGYLGVNGGYAFGNNVGPITFTNSAAQTFTTTGTTFNPKGGFGGGQIGYNWQSGTIVYGVEADIQGAALKSNIAGGVTGFGDIYAGTRNINFFGTFRGRVGVAAGNALFYATGGFAYGQVRDSIVRTSTLGWVVGNSGDQAGYVVGGGIEYKFTQAWSAKVEYQYINLGHDTLNGTYLPANVTTIQSNALNDHFSTVRAGLNFHIN